MTGLPMWWWFRQPDVPSSASPRSTNLLRKHVLSSDRQTAAFVVLGPLSVFAVHGSASIPVNIGINAHSMALAVVGTFGSIAIALMYMWFIGVLVAVPEPVTVVAPAAQDEALTRAQVGRSRVPSVA